MRGQGGGMGSFGWGLCDNRPTEGNTMFRFVKEWSVLYGELLGSA